MAKLKTIKIHNKEYVEVNQRIKYFRENYPDGSLITEMVSNENGVCVFKATAIIDDKARSTGWAYEKEGSSNINKTSYLENCETSALGRCLGNLGIGIDGSVASAEEVQTAILQQEELDKQCGQALAEISETIGESNAEATAEIWNELKQKPNGKQIADFVWKNFNDQERIFVKESLH
jgi:hypothetical protein